jgi:hypothetical protein
MRTVFHLCSTTLLALLLTSCYGTTRVEGGVVYDYPVVQVEAAPMHIDTYPRVYYRGNYAYLVEGRWYYPTASGWVVFRQEPEVLSSYRVRYYRQYPHRVNRRHEMGTPAPRQRPRPRRRYYSD